MNPIVEVVVAQLIVGFVTFVCGSLTAWVIYIGRALRQTKHDLNCAHQSIRSIIADTKDLNNRVDCLERALYYQGD